MIHVNPIWPLGHIDAEAPLGHIDAEAPLGHIDGKADDRTIQQVGSPSQVGSTSQMHKSLLKVKCNMQRLVQEVLY